MFHDTNPPPTEVPPGESWKSTTDLHSPGKTEHVWGEHLQLLWGRQLAEEDLTGSFSCKYVTEFEIQCNAVYLLDRSVTDFWGVLAYAPLLGKHYMSGGNFCLADDEWLYPAGFGPGGRLTRLSDSYCCSKCFAFFHIIMVLSTFINFYQLLSTFINFLSTFYQLFINFLSTFYQLFFHQLVVKCFINFYQLFAAVYQFVNNLISFFLSTFINCLSTFINLYQLVFINLLSTFISIYQLFINIYQLFITFFLSTVYYQLFINLAICHSGAPSRCQIRFNSPKANQNSQLVLGSSLILKLQWW